MESIDENTLLARWNGQTAPLLSIVCLTYNHAAFIRQALDGFLMQETRFPFEIIVHDDASTDETPTIIAEYAAPGCTSCHSEGVDFIRSPWPLP